MALLCAQSLAVPGAPKVGGFNLDSYCKDQIYKSHYQEGNLDLDYNQLSTQPFEKRVCAVYDFYRKSKLFEQKDRIWRIRSTTPANEIK